LWNAYAGSSACLMGSGGLNSGKNGEGVLILVNGVSYGLNSDRDVGRGVS
jgi:hypothetical protein